MPVVVSLKMRFAVLAPLGFIDKLLEGVHTAVAPFAATTPSAHLGSSTFPDHTTMVAVRVDEQAKAKAETSPWGQESEVSVVMRKGACHSAVRCDQHLLLMASELLPHTKCSAGSGITPALTSPGIRGCSTCASTKKEFLEPVAISST